VIAESIPDEDSTKRPLLKGYLNGTDRYLWFKDLLGIG
jgi:hypothetical protein